MNFTSLDVGVLLNIGNNFSISSLSKKLNSENSAVYYSLVKIERGGFITSSPYRLTKKGFTFIETFIKCYYFEVSRNQRETEIKRGLGNDGTKGFEDIGCYSCNGLNTNCLKYLNTETLRAGSKRKCSLYSVS